MPMAGEHFLELMPGLGAFDGHAALSEPAGYRVMDRIPLARFSERAEWLRETLANRDRLKAMSEACREFAARAYHKKTVSDYICAEVERRIGSGARA